jgi:hypothetical protein
MQRPPVHINSGQLPQGDVQYLGLHLDRRLTWHKRKQLGNHPHLNPLGRGLVWLRIGTGGELL